eukprot:m.12784 g.12784  ORF g.12784 m.12784 type:complete len:551 (+) comp9441_c0_seq1:207-1859(+)
MSGTQRPPTRLNHNVKLALWFTFVSTAARNVWAWVTLTLYLKSLTGSTFNVGLAEGVQGAVQAGVAIIAGFGADKYRRDVGLRWAGGIGLVTIGFTIFCLYVGDSVLLGRDVNETDVGSAVNRGDLEEANTLRYSLISVALGMWGVYQGVWNTLLETVFADSVRTGDRSAFNVRKFMLLQAASVVGPILALVIFLDQGNTWYHYTLRLVFVVGVALCAPGACILLFFNDEHSLGKESESVSTGANSPAEQTVEEGGKQTDLSHISITPRLSIAKIGGTFCGLTMAHIPHILIASDMISGLASGMTIKFFPLYFARKVWLEPVYVQSIYIALPLFMIVASKLGQKASAVFGRVSVSVTMSVLGAAALAGIFVLEHVADWDCFDCPIQHGTTEYDCKMANITVDGLHEAACKYTTLPNDGWTCTPIVCKMKDRWYVSIGLYFISTLQHCSRPLKKSILMDYTAKRTRARWNSLDSVTRFGWSGSAVLGGWLISKYSFGTTFLVTAGAQCVSSSVLLLIIPLMGRDNEIKKAKSPEGTVSERAPLIQGRNDAD